MDKIEPKVANVGLPGQLYMCIVILRLLKLQKWIWDYLNVYGSLREQSKFFMKKLLANMFCILDKIDDQDKDVILSSQYNIVVMLWRFLIM